MRNLSDIAEGDDGSAIKKAPAFWPGPIGRKKSLILAGHYVCRARPLFALSYLELDALAFV